MTDRYKNDVGEWSYPDMNLLSDEGEKMFFPEDDECCVDTELEPELGMSKEKKNEVESERIKSEINDLKNIYQHKIEVLNNMINKLQSPLTNVDDELIYILQTIIKKCVKNIIHVELEKDSQLIIAIINDLLEFMKGKSEIITICLSETDYARLIADGYQSHHQVVADQRLANGDVIVKCDFTEIRSILDDRIDKLIGVSHE